MTITARYPATCSDCKQPIVAGELINWERGKKPTHVGCGAPAKTSYQPGRQYARSRYLNRPAYAHEDPAEQERKRQRAELDARAAAVYATINFDTKELVSTRQSAWYDHTYYRVKVNGPINTSMIQYAMSGAWRNSLTGTAVGGYCTPGEVKDNGDGTITFEQVYHLGD